MTKQMLVEKYQSLFWYFDKNKLADISDAVVVEFILNYGDMQALRDVFATFGKENIAEIFKKSIANKRDNYFPQVKHFFHLYFQKYAPEYTL